MGAEKSRHLRLLGKQWSAVVNGGQRDVCRGHRKVGLTRVTAEAVHLNVIYLYRTCIRDLIEVSTLYRSMLTNGERGSNKTRVYPLEFYWYSRIYLII